MGGIPLTIERGIGAGQDTLLDCYRPRDTDGSPVVLLWHGRGPNERGVLGALASAIARRGFVVVVPDWEPDTPVSGCRPLLSSLRFALDNAAAHGGIERGSSSAAGHSARTQPPISCSTPWGPVTGVPWAWSPWPGASTSHRSPAGHWTTPMSIPSRASSCTGRRIRSFRSGDRGALRHCSPAEGGPSGASSRRRITPG